MEEKGRSNPVAWIFLDVELKQWMQDPKLESVRDPKQSTKLDTGWAKLWADIAKLQKAIAQTRKSSRFSGKLTPGAKEQKHRISVKKGRLYRFELRSNEFDTLLQIHDDQGRKRIADNIAPDNRNSRMIFRVSVDRELELDVRSPVLRGRGAYQLHVLEYPAYTTQKPNSKT